MIIVIYMKTDCQVLSIARGFKFLDNTIANVTWAFLSFNSNTYYEFIFQVLLESFRNFKAKFADLRSFLNEFKWDVFCCNRLYLEAFTFCLYHEISFKLFEIIIHRIKSEGHRKFKLIKLTLKQLLCYFWR